MTKNIVKLFSDTLFVFYGGKFLEVTSLLRG